MRNRLAGAAWLIVCLGVAVDIVGSRVAWCAVVGTSDDVDIIVHVTRNGDDANDGRSRQTAFASMQRAVDTLQPGQTLVIGPGEY